MKQLHHSVATLSMDMTECKLNRIIDRDGKARFIASFPAEWEAVEPDGFDVTRPDGKTQAKMKMYKVTRWEEVELEVKE